jgi:hypothetical protein
MSPSRPSPVRATPPTTGGNTATPRHGPPSPRWSPKGPDPGREGAASSHRVTPPPRGCLIATSSSGTARRRRNVADQGAPPQIRRPRASLPNERVRAGPPPPAPRRGFARRPTPAAAAGGRGGRGLGLGLGKSPPGRPRGTTERDEAFFPWHRKI